MRRKGLKEDLKKFIPMRRFASTGRGGGGYAGGQKHTALHPCRGKENVARQRRNRELVARRGARGGRRRSGGCFGVDGVAVGRDLKCEEVECQGDEQEESEKCGGEDEAGGMGDGVAELRADEERVVWLGENEDRVVLIHGKKAGVILRGRSARKIGGRGAAEVVWGEGGSGGGGGIETGVGIPAKLGSGWGRHEKMQTGYGKAGGNGEQGKDFYWGGGDFNANIGRGKREEGGMWEVWSG